MTPQEKLKEIKETWSAFKHWSDKDPDSRYADSAGPDVAWLIARVEQLESSALDVVNDHDLQHEDASGNLDKLREAITTGPKPGKKNEENYRRVSFWRGIWYRQYRCFNAGQDMETSLMKRAFAEWIYKEEGIGHTGFGTKAEIKFYMLFLKVNKLMFFEQV